MSTTASPVRKHLWTADTAERRHHLGCLPGGPASHVFTSISQNLPDLRLITIYRSLSTMKEHETYTLGLRSLGVFGAVETQRLEGRSDAVVRCRGN